MNNIVEIDSFDLNSDRFQMIKSFDIDYDEQEGETYAQHLSHSSTSLPASFASSSSSSSLSNPPSSQNTSIFGFEQRFSVLEMIENNDIQFNSISDFLDDPVLCRQFTMFHFRALLIKDHYAVNADVSARMIAKKYGMTYDYRITFEKDKLEILRISDMVGNAIVTMEVHRNPRHQLNKITFYKITVA